VYDPSVTANVRAALSAICAVALVVDPPIFTVHDTAAPRVAPPAVSVIVAPAPDPLTPTVKVVVPQVPVTGDALIPPNVKSGTFSAISSLVASGALSVKVRDKLEAVLVVGDAIVNALDEITAAISVDVTIFVSGISVEAAKATDTLRDDQLAFCAVALVVTPVIVTSHGVAWFRVALPAVSVIVALPAPPSAEATVKVVVPQVLVTGDAPTPANVKYGTFSAISSLVASGALSVKVRDKLEAVLGVLGFIDKSLATKAGR